MKIQLKSNLDFLNLHTYSKINIKMKVTPSQWGFPSSSDGKAPACNAGDRGLILGLGRSPAEGNGNPVQYPCLVNPMDRGVWQATVHGVNKESDTSEQLTHKPPQ